MPESGQIVLIPYPDTPAEKAGIERGDILIAVDGHSVEGQTVRSVVDLVGGPEGTKVRLRLLRAGEPDPLELDVFRGNVEIPTVINQPVPGGIGYLRITRFQENTGDQTFAALESMNRLDLLALILDLRFNFGGSAEAASEVAGQFLPPGSLFRSVEDREGVRSQHLIAEDINRLELDDVLLAVLVNDGTAGEAEAVAVALQEAGRAVIVGTETYGEASNYEFVELSDGSAIYIPTSRWFTPSGEWLGGTGIDPDEFVVSRPEDEGVGRESQFNRAYDYLDAQLPPFR
jgi:carboxyl-terminal processing protease